MGPIIPPMKTTTNTKATETTPTLLSDATDLGLKTEVVQPKGYVRIEGSAGIVRKALAAQGWDFRKDGSNCWTMWDQAGRFVATLLIDGKGWGYAYTCSI